MATIKKSDLLAVNVQIAKLLAEGKTSEALALVNSQNEKLAKTTGGGRKSTLFVEVASDIQAIFKNLPAGVYRVIDGQPVAVAPVERDIDGVKAHFMLSYSYPGGKSAKAMAKEKAKNTEAKVEPPVVKVEPVKTEVKTTEIKGKGKH